MFEDWQVAPWAFAVIGGPIILGLGILWGVINRRRRASVSKRTGEAPEYRADS